MAPKAVHVKYLSFLSFASAKTSAGISAGCHTGPLRYENPAFCACNPQVQRGERETISLVAEGQIKSLSARDRNHPHSDLGFRRERSARSLSVLQRKRAETRPAIQPESPLMKAGSKLLHEPSAHKRLLSGNIVMRPRHQSRTPQFVRGLISMAHWREEVQVRTQEKC